MGQVLTLTWNVYCRQIAAVDAKHKEVVTVNKTWENCINFIKLLYMAVILSAHLEIRLEFETCWEKIEKQNSKKWKPGKGKGVILCA